MLLHSMGGGLVGLPIGPALQALFNPGGPLEGLHPPVSGLFVVICLKYHFMHHWLTAVIIRWVLMIHEVS